LFLDKNDKFQIFFYCAFSAFFSVFLAPLSMLAIRSIGVVITESLAITGAAALNRILKFLISANRGHK